MAAEGVEENQTVSPESTGNNKKRKRKKKKNKNKKTEGNEETEGCNSALPEDDNQQEDQDPETGADHRRDEEHTREEHRQELEESSKKQHVSETKNEGDKKTENERTEKESVEERTKSKPDQGEPCKESHREDEQETAGMNSKQRRKAKREGMPRKRVGSEGCEDDAPIPKHRGDAPASEHTGLEHGETESQRKSGEHARHREHGRSGEDDGYGGHGGQRRQDRSDRHDGYGEGGKGDRCRGPGGLAARGGRGGQWRQDRSDRHDGNGEGGEGDRYRGRGGQGRNERYDRRDGHGGGGKDDGYGERSKHGGRRGQGGNDRYDRRSDYGGRGEGDRYTGSGGQRGNDRYYGSGGYDGGGEGHAGPGGVDPRRGQQYRSIGRGGARGGGYAHARRREEPDVQISKKLSFLLRHGAKDQGFTIEQGGFLRVDHILKSPAFKNISIKDIQRIVDNDRKSRYALKTDEEGNMLIRANQGHTIEVDVEMRKVTDPNEFPTVVHGTYYENWESIKETGLSTMGRQHIHFAIGLPRDKSVISGMRTSCQVMIYMDMTKALEDGIPFFQSANNVILSPGDKDGVISPQYFSKVVDKSGADLLA